MRSYDSVCVQSVQHVMDIFGNKWAFLILEQLQLGTMRISQLQKSLDISTKSLADTLKNFEKHGIIRREVIPTTIPITVEYSLTEKARAFDNVLLAMKEWNRTWNV